MAGQQQDRKQEIGAGPGQQHGDALPVRAVREGTRQVLRRHRRLALIEQLDVAARAVPRPARIRCDRRRPGASTSARPKPTEKRSTLKPSRRATQ